MVARGLRGVVPLTKLMPDGRNTGKGKGMPFIRPSIIYRQSVMKKNARFHDDGVEYSIDTPRKVVETRRLLRWCFRTFGLKTRIYFLALFVGWSLCCRAFSHFQPKNAKLILWVYLLGMGGLVCCCSLFVGYGWFVVVCWVWEVSEFISKSANLFSGFFVGYGRPGIYPLFHKRFIAKLFGEYLSFFQFPFILVARLK